MEQDQKHYYAFISHSSKDEKIAKWLCRRIERYHIPTAVQKVHHAPKRLKPIFLYEMDLSQNVLKNALENELIDSQYLIVICSPIAAKSSHVNDEVSQFVNSGRYNKIIPFIVEGKPFASLNGNTEEECYPPALVELKGTEKELRGINLYEEEKQRGSKMAAVADVIASMLGVRFDVLYRRYQRDRRRKICLFILATMGIISLFFMIWYQKQQVKLNLSYAITEKAAEQLTQGDAYLAALLALQVLPTPENPDGIWNLKADEVLRESLQQNTFILQSPYVSWGTRDLFFTADNKYIIVDGAYNDTLYHEGYRWDRAFLVFDTQTGDCLIKYTYGLVEKNPNIEWDDHCHLYSIIINDSNYIVQNENPYFETQIEGSKVRVKKQTEEIPSDSHYLFSISSDDFTAQPIDILCDVNGNYIGIETYKGISIYDFSGALVDTTKIHITSIDFSPIEDETCIILDYTPLKIQYNNDKTRMLIVDFVGNVEIRDLESNTYNTLSGEEIVSAVFSEDEESIYILLENGEIWEKHFPSYRSVITEAINRFGKRELTSEERRKYYLE